MAELGLYFTDEEAEAWRGPVTGQAIGRTRSVRVAAPYIPTTRCWWNGLNVLCNFKIQSKFKKLVYTV